MKIRAIKECPNQSVGTVFDAPDMAAKVLIDIGAAEAVTDAPVDPIVAEAQQESASEAAAAQEPIQTGPVAAPKKRRQYRRRDLTPEK